MVPFRPRGRAAGSTGPSVEMERGRRNLPLFPAADWCDGGHLWIGGTGSTARVGPSPDSSSERVCGCRCLIPRKSKLPRSTEGEANDGS